LTLERVVSEYMLWLSAADRTDYKIDHVQLTHFIWCTKML